MTDRVITGISGVRADRRTDMVEVDCSAGSHPQRINLHRGVLGTLVASLLQAARAFPGESEEFLSQPLQLQGASVISFEDGTLGLELLLDDGLRLFVAVPRESIAGLRSCANLIGALGNAMTEERSGMTQH